ncbi:hypothetical protein [Tissierella praeacuta]
MKILEYLLINRYHIAVKMIYNDLHNEIPALSKTIIYNALSYLLKFSN